MNSIDDLINALIKKEEECLRAYENDNDIKYYGSYIALGYASVLANELKLNMEKNNNE